MERLDGIRGLEVKGAPAAGISAEDLALRAARVYLQMIFQDGFYHADPHPGNYLVLPGGVLGILDAGMVGRVGEALRTQRVVTAIIGERTVASGTPGRRDRPGATAVGVPGAVS